MKKHSSFSSLTKLRKEVITELKKMDKQFTVSLSRIRTIAAHSGFIKVEVKKRYDINEHTVCPVCDSYLKPVKNWSLLGEKIVIGYKCERCNYKARKNEGPLRYLFQLSS